MTASDDKGVIAVTGANRGIGAATALELARRGYRVACLTRKGAGIEEFPVPDNLADRLAPHTCDVTDEGAVTKALRSAAEKSGGLRGLVNNAGIHLIGPSASFATADFAAVQQVNVIALFAVCREAYPYLKAAGGGTIINMGSFFDRMGVPHNAAYAASKAALGAITRCLAVEWAADGITVLNIAPGYVQTDLNREYLARDKVRETLLPRIPLRRPGRPDEVARLVGALLDEDIEYLTGETIYMDGGHVIAH